MALTAIVAALHQEIAAVLALMPDEHKRVSGGREFWTGHLHGHEVVVVLSRVGKVAAATTATALIERFGVSRIVFTGVAGGLAPGVAVGDVVVADTFMQHDLDASPLFPRYEVPMTGLSRLRSDPALSDALAAAAGAAMPAARVHRGLVLSGDRFICTAADGLALQRALPEALAVEMEGAAVAQVCHDYGIPFAALRTISDRADDAAHVDFLSFVDTVASRYSAAIVKALLASL
ncbi:MAG: 5'-methylthioadenosine/adenosylhomocysteine nucleosidase [Burkholderiaceae bacterium]|nr:5'-methylthioadenosine/adenosylhomocysteine nucleosidase [Burkholderiaceae bacterium]